MVNIITIFLSKCLGLVNTNHINDEGKVDKSFEHHIELFKAGKYAAEALQSSKQALNFIAAFVEILVILPRVKAIGFGWRDGIKAQIQRKLSGFVSLISPIHENRQSFRCVLPIG